MRKNIKINPIKIKILYLKFNDNIYFKICEIFLYLSIKNYSKRSYLVLICIIFASMKRGILKYYIGISIILIFIVGLSAYYILYGIYRPEVNINKSQYPVMGIDISAHNGNIDFQKVENDSIMFVYMKATEGASYTDPNFESNYNSARETSLKLGAYHFFRFEVNGTLQGMNFLNMITDKSLDLPLVIDVEDWGNKEVPTGSVIKRLQEMIDFLSEHGYKIVLYTNNNGYKRYIQSYFADYPLWLCRFTSPSDSVKWTFWQYSHWGEVDGVKGDVDLDLFNGDFKDFNKYISNLYPNEEEY